MRTATCQPPLRSSAEFQGVAKSNHRDAATVTKSVLDNKRIRSCSARRSPCKKILVLITTLAPHGTSYPIESIAPVVLPLAQHEPNLIAASDPYTWHGVAHRSPFPLTEPGKRET